MDAYPPDLSDFDRSVVLPFLSGRNVGCLGLTTPTGSEQGCKETLRTASAGRRCQREKHCPAPNLSPIQGDRLLEDSFPGLKPRAEFHCPFPGRRHKASQTALIFVPLLTDPFTH